MIPTSCCSQAISFFDQSTVALKILNDRGMDERQIVDVLGITQRDVSQLMRGAFQPAHHGQATGSPEATRLLGQA